MLFFEVISQFFQFLMDLIIYGQAKIKNTINIYIKSSTGSTISVDLDPKWDIKNVKEIVAPQLGLEPEDVKIIFAGKELLDTTIIGDCDLGEQSILHAVRSNRRVQHPSKPLCKTLEELTVNENADEDNDPVAVGGDKNKAHFYVYCATCKATRTGKLRVRCQLCKSGAFTVDNDPQSWTHVLEKEQITGECHNQDCHGLYAEFFFKCAEHVSQGETDTAVPLNLIRANNRGIPCLACTDVSETVLVFPCNAAHVTCVDCFRDYCSSRLKERQFISHADLGYTLPCPARCENSYISEIHHFRLLTETQYEQYQRFATEEFILQAGGILCPQPGCGMGILIDSNCDTVKCSYGCEFVFCAKCRQGYHLGDCAEIDNTTPATNSSSYSVDPERAEQARWDEASSTTIRRTSKPCPKCRTSTERFGGCMHMVCTRANCGYNWCWVCQGPWGTDCMAAHWFG